jgi:predicted phosphodiesterase
VAFRERTPTQHRETLDLVASHDGNVMRAAKAMGISRATLQSQVERAKQWEAKGAPELESFTSGRRLPQTSDDCWAVLDDFIGRSRKPARSQSREHGKKQTSRIVIASDFHAPFADPWAVAELITREGGKGSTLIVNGDIQDFYAISRFTKYEQVSIESELAAVDALLGQLSVAFGEVVLVGGNHDTHRFEKQLRSFLSPEMVHVVEFLTGGNLSVLRVIAKRYTNVTFPTVEVGRHGVGWFAQVGDLVTAHAEKYSRVPGTALRGIDEWFTDQHDILGIQPWKVLIQAHTHMMGMFPWKADKLLVEGGCMCQTHGYQLQARIMGRPQRLGYVTLEQTKGVTDLNSVRLVWLDADRKAA